MAHELAYIVSVGGAVAGGIGGVGGGNLCAEGGGLPRGNHEVATGDGFFCGDAAGKFEKRLPLLFVAHAVVGIYSYFQRRCQAFDALLSA